MSSITPMDELNYIFNFTTLLSNDFINFLDLRVSNLKQVIYLLSHTKI